MTVLFLGCSHILGISLHGLVAFWMCYPQSVKGKGKVRPRTGYEGTEGSRGIALLFF